MNDKIKEPVLRELVRTRVDMRATIQGVRRGFLVCFRFGNQEKTLETARGETRLFATLDTAASLVHDVGLPQFDVDMGGYQPGRLRKARPDRAAAMKLTRTRMRQQSLGI